MNTQPTHFVHLRVHTAYSLAEGAIRIKDLAQLCLQHGMPAAAVTDTNNMFGVMEFSLELSAKGIQPIPGLQACLEETGVQLVLLAKNEAGYKNLCKLISRAYFENKGQSEPFLHLSWLETCNDGLICLSGGPLKGHRKSAELETLHTLFPGHFYVELQRHHLAEEERVEPFLVKWAQDNDVPLVATNDCMFPTRAFHEAHEALLCIAQGSTIGDENRRRVTPHHYLKSPEEMAELFQDLPEAIQNTLVIAQRCSFYMKPVDPILPPFTSMEERQNGCDENDELKAQAEEGLAMRLRQHVFIDEKGSFLSPDPETEKTYRERLAYELEVIRNMGYPGYFLIVSDFIKWAKQNKIPVGPGRGSGAGSIVAWALQITDLDPIRFDLLFERFLNPERVSMPDFDVDFCQERRDEVIAYVQNKYGFDKVAQIITFGKLQAKAVVRDVGRVMQLPYGQVDRIAKMIPFNPAHPVTLQEAINQGDDLRQARDEDETIARLLDIALQLEGLYRHASTHAAGVVIGDRPLDDLIPLYRDPRSEMPVTQYNMKYVEIAGLVKFDFLGLKTMTVIQKTVDLVREKVKEIDILKLPLDDPETYALLSKGQTTGVFQLESGGMRDMLRKVKPDRFEEIIALVSLYRPGPMDNIPKYIAVKHGDEEPDYLHPLLKPLLEETYGIMIYQEQVMQAAQELAGYTLGEADLLRRAMGKKIKEAMDAERDKFVKGAKEVRGVDPDQANFIFDQIAKFAGYGFNKSHAAAYALIAYWTAWLKTHYPHEFMAASMSLDIHNTDKLAVFKQELDQMGIKLLPPDINRSFSEFTVEGESVRYTMSALKGVGEKAVETIVQEREGNGDYKSLADFLSRLDSRTMNRRQFEVLSASGSLDGLHDNRAQLYTSAEMLVRYAHTLASEKERGQAALFGNGGDNASLPRMEPIPEWDDFDKLRYEYEAIGFYLSSHPLDAHREMLEELGFSFFSRVNEVLEEQNSYLVETAAVTGKIQSKFSAKIGRKFAILQLSDPTGAYEAMLYADQLAQYRDILEEGKAYYLKIGFEMREDQIRGNIIDLQPFEQYLKGKEQSLTIPVRNNEEVGRLKSILDRKISGKVKVLLSVSARDYEGVIALKGGYALSFSEQSRLKNLSD